MQPYLSVNHYICGPDISFPTFAAAAEKAGLSAVGLSRAAVTEMGVAPLRRCLADHGLAVSSLNSVGYFTDPDRKRVDAGNLELIEAAAELDAEVLCVICGGLGDTPMPLAEGQALVRDGFGPLAARAADAGVTLGVEPIHPMDVLTKGCINSIAGALELIHGDDTAKLILDFYHSWWDPDLVRLAHDAADRVALIQVCNIRLRDGVPVGRDTLASGALNTAAMLRELLGGAYRGRLELELFERDLGARDALDIVAEFPGQLTAVLGD